MAEVAPEKWLRRVRRRRSYAMWTRLAQTIETYGVPPSVVPGVLRAVHAENDAMQAYHSASGAAYAAEALVLMLDDREEEAAMARARAARSPAPIRGVA